MASAGVPQMPVVFAVLVAESVTPYVASGSSESWRKVNGVIGIRGVCGVLKDCGIITSRLETVEKRSIYEK
jgi:hypothetical protein